MITIDQPWLTEKGTQKVCTALTAKGARAYFVGGCVRNALLGTPVNDLDISTDARPETVLELARAAGIKAIPTGIEHGTITLVVDGNPYEVTTFRKDVATDGRRAVVAFSTDMKEDAHRRDITMNALYADAAGQVFDPLGGLEDLKARRVRFIGNGGDRIREDYLRALRFFRFHAWYGDVDAGFDPDALDAIASNLDGLPELSRERVGTELLKLLAARDPAPAVAGMRQTGVLGTLLPGIDDHALALLCHFDQGVRPDAIRRLAALGSQELVAPMRLSKAQGARLRRLRTAATGTQGAAELGYRLGSEEARDALFLRAALLEQPVISDLERDIRLGAQAKFPISSKDLIARFQGVALGDELRRLEGLWINSGFALDKDALLKPSE